MRLSSKVISCEAFFAKTGTLERGVNKVKERKAPSPCVHDFVIRRVTRNSLCHQNVTHEVPNATQSLFPCS
jgi:hypothetical protein